MTAWKCRSLAVLLLMLVAFSSLLNLAVAVSARADSKPCVFAFEVTYAAQIAEECEFDRARHRKAHFMRGPPVV